MVFKSRRIWWARHEASSGEKRKVHIILNQKSEEKRPLGCRRHILEPNSKYINKEIFLSYESVKRHKNRVWWQTANRKLLSLIAQHIEPASISDRTSDFFSSTGL
jgi:hypothetical protein